MLLNVVLSLALPPLFESVGWFAHGGLALANSLATLLEMVGLLWLIRGRLGGLEGRHSLPMLLRSTTAAVLMGLALSVSLWVLPDINPLLLGPIGVVLGGVGYLGAAWVLGVQEVRDVVGHVKRRAKVR